MKQSKLMSMVETGLSTAAGFGISLLAQMYFLPLLGVTISLHQNFAFAIIMTFVSLARGFVLRRIFEAMHIRRPLSPAMSAVIAERFRQVEVEGWSIEHDDKHCGGDLAYAGAAYARHAADTQNRLEAHALEGSLGKLPPPAWPWEPAWWKPQDYRRNLIKGCALILAEIEKFDRYRKRK